MTHVLITGMTASQASPRTNTRTQTYAGQLAAQIFSAGHTIAWEPVSVEASLQDYDQYGKIFVGIAPLLSIGSAHAYGILRLIDLLHEDPRVVFFIDAPRPDQILASLRALRRNQEQLVKPFFSNRPGYTDVAYKSADWASVQRGLNILTYIPWPKTLYPNLPWGEEPRGGFDSLLGLNMDSTYAPTVDDYKRKRLHYWVADNVNAPWTRKIENHLSYGVAPMKGSKFAKDDQVRVLMSTMVGSLIAPQRDGTTWWTPRYVQSLSVGTPVATEWRESQALGPEWAYLAATVEDLDEPERFALAQRQMSSYLSTIPTNQQIRATLDSIINP